MKTEVSLPRIHQITGVHGYEVSVVFTNGENRKIDLQALLSGLGISEQQRRVLLDSQEFGNVKLANHTLSWAHAGAVISFKGKSKQVPFEIGADVLFESSQPEQSLP